MSSEWWQQIRAADHLGSNKDITSSENTKREVDFIERQLSIPLGGKILDIACGSGRHSLALSAKGYQVIGLDYCQELLEIATREGVRQKANGPLFVRGDMRNLPVGEKFDAVLSMWHSLGYFKSDEQNWVSIEEISRTTKRGGHCLIHLNNPFPKIAEILAKGNADGFLRSTETLETGGVVKKVSWVDLPKFRYHSRREWFSPDGGVNVSEHNFRYFTFPEIQSILSRLGFVEIYPFGGFDDEKYDFTSKWLIVTAKKQ